MGLLSADACWVSCGNSGEGCAADAVCPNGPGLLPIRLRMPSNSSAPPATPAAVAIAERRKLPPPPCCGATAACRGERVGGTEGRGPAGAAGAPAVAPQGPILGALPRKPDAAGVAPALASSSAMRSCAAFSACSWTSTVCTSRYGAAGWRTARSLISASASPSRGWDSNGCRRPNRPVMSSRSSDCMTVPPALSVQRAPSTWLSALLASRVQGAQAQFPRFDTEISQQALDDPAIWRQARLDLVPVLGPHDQQHVARARERAAQQHKTVGGQPVHEVCMAPPVDLPFHGLRIVPVRAARVDDGEEACGYVRYTLV